MKIGLIDVDGHNFPNLPLMKISAWHKKQGDQVEWYEPFSGVVEKYDIVYMSKVFSFSADYNYPIYADKVIKGGSGYCIEIVDGKEKYQSEKDLNLPYEIEHIYPDYSLYPDLTKNTAYGFLSRGCPRGCDFCHVKDKEGKKAYKVANLSEFWRGQKNIVICDPNILACAEWEDLLNQLVSSGSNIDINQGLDIRLMTKEKAKIMKSMKCKSVRFAWDRYEDKDVIVPKFEEFKNISGWDERKLIVYVLVNFDTTFEQDLERVYLLRDMGYSPYIMIYNKDKTNSKDKVRRLQRYVNNRFIFRSCVKFEDYKG